MSLATYTIQIYDPRTGGRIGYYSGSQLREIRFSRLLNDIGAMVLSFERDVDAVYSLFNLKDLLVDIVRDNIVEGTYIVSSRQRLVDGNTQIVNIGGLSLESLLSRRLIDPTDDSVQPNGGYVTKAGPVDTILAELVDEQIGPSASSARQIPNLSVVTPSGIGDLTGFRKRYGTLLVVIQNFLSSRNIDLKMTRSEYTNIEIKFEKRGNDKSYSTHAPTGPYTIFSILRGNLNNPDHVIDYQDEITCVYVAGPGEGANRTILIVPDVSRVIQSPYGRIESFVDYRSASSETSSLSQQLNAEALNQLNGGLPEITFTFDLQTNISGSTYRNDWDLGDIVTVFWEPIQDDVRINKVEIQASAQGETIEMGVMAI